MGTKIEWTDETWNPVTGCSVVSPGCANCYAATLSKRYGWTKKPWHPQHAAENVVLHNRRIDAPLSWRKPRRVFVNSMSDLFHEQVPFDFIDYVFQAMSQTPQHIYQVLTKRPERMRQYITDHDTPFRIQMIRAGIQAFGGKPGGSPVGKDNWPLKNVWLGVSVENQRWAEVRIGELFHTPAAVRFLSCEPLLGPLDLFPWVTTHLRCEHGNVAPEADTRCQPCGCWPDRTALDWVIVGGESGPRRRPMLTEWARSIRDQCQVGGVSFFLKQLGGLRPGGDAKLDGQEYRAFPSTAMPTITPRGEE